ncbi:hypothetical protein AB6A40_002233 [Gnathostoma spinigerum]|uniref:RRM domain-containing protein n=1 Tax=Gnathostoma spinigerum TaxID=75299 RepID=A0ABD6E627_9BILA
MGADEPRFRVLHVSNISMTATREQIYQLFSFIGRIDDFKIYPSESHPQLSTFTQKFAYVKFEEQKSVEIAQHLTNTVFIDRALVCIPSISDTIPDEETALKMGGPAWPGQRQLPPNVTNQIQDVGDGQQMLLTVDPTLSALGLPPYPALSANTDPAKIEEIRRTVYVGNLPKDCNGEDVMQFFNDNIGEVMYLRLTSGNENLPCAYAYIEFTNQPTVPIALQNNGIEYKGRYLRIQHSRVAIIKPERKTADMALQEVEEAIRVHQDPDKSSSALNKLNSGLGIDRAYSPLRRSISPRRRSRSRSRDRRRRSRSRSHHRSRHRSRSRSRDRRDRSRNGAINFQIYSEHRRSSRSHHRSRSRDRRDKEKDRPKEKEKDRREKEKEKEREREKEKDRKERRRSRSRSKSPQKKDDRKNRDKIREREKEKKREKERESDHKKDKGRRDKDKSREKEREREKNGRDKERDKEREKGRKRTENKSSTAKNEVKLQIEDGEGMDVGTTSSTTDETAIRERLVEKVMARNSGSIKSESTESNIDKKTEKKEQPTESDDESPKRKRRRSRKESSSSSSVSEGSESD